MIDFLYRGDYQTDVDSGEQHHAVLHAAMFAVADKYNIAALGDAAKVKFQKSIKSIVWISPDIGSFMDVIEYVYSTTPESNRGLRDIVVRQIQILGTQITADPKLNSRLEGIIASTPSFAMDLIRNSFVQASPRRCSACDEYLGDGTICTDHHCGNNDYTRAQFGVFGNAARDMSARATEIFGRPWSDANPAAGPPAFGS